MTEKDFSYHLMNYIYASLEVAGLSEEHKESLRHGVKLLIDAADLDGIMRNFDKETRKDIDVIFLLRLVDLQIDILKEDIK